MPNASSLPLRNLLATGLLALVALAAFGNPASPAAPIDPAVQEVLSRFSKAQASIETLQAEFEERKNLSLLSKEVVLTGTLYHSRPLNFLWDYQTPSPKQILLTQDSLVAYYPELNKAEEVNVRRWNQRIRRYLQIGLNLDELRKDYDIELGTVSAGEPEGADLLILVPRKKRRRSRLQEIRVWADKETGHTRQITYLESNGDASTFTFRNIQVNAGIPETVYHIDLPHDVRMGDSFTGFAGG